mmetsp:Transcript_6506/g.19756  ORF Transcript_6506/g.19756 Transcript_6506/m.19756 type:complete len:748 (-) Transcript_6506:305-2548(-)|eukprot:CAMPEP_0198734612 /NCGR_PEP_ID=MMETSP1475-20131203/53932_1 /TAXON_ID= ORGANISM="Unidentified sp., Strain CCMP1999" /NCGR_SAMPLE_ID=MMETSP1475 /ASSEMBLY_ACC=CAM_ASM_001111 /LENGTH=747 /DNA_ID=CAMNT_0044498123 /DNA_START=110 /DNA_END=2353 /DNA_ORIENTATION=+
MVMRTARTVQIGCLYRLLNFSTSNRYRKLIAPAGSSALSGSRSLGAGVLSVATGSLIAWTGFAACEPTVLSPRPSTQDELAARLSQCDAEAIRTLEDTLESNDNLPQIARSNIPSALTQALQEVLKREDRDLRTVERLLRIIASVSEKQAAVTIFVQAGLADLLYKQLTSVGWRYTPKSMFSFFKRIFTDSSFLEQTDAEATPHGKNTTELCMKIFANLARHSKSFRDLIDEDTVRLFIQIVNMTQSDFTRRNAVLALACFASTSDEFFAESLATKILITRSADDADPEMQWFAAGGVRNMLKHSSSHRMAVIAGVIPALIKTMQCHKNPKAQALAASAVADLATSSYARAEVIRTRMLDQNIFLELGNLLKSSNESVIRSTCKAIDEILNGAPKGEGSFQKIVSQFDAADVPYKVTRYATMKSAPVATAATSALYTMAGIDGMSDKMLEAGASKIIIASCNSLDPGIQARALDALACLSEREHRQDFLVRGAVLKMILSLRSTNPMITRPLVTTIANFSRQEKLRPEIAHEGGLPLLNAMVLSGNIDIETKREALRAFYNLSVHGLSRVMVVQYGSLRPIVTSLKSDDKVVQSFAVRTLSNLLESLEYSLKAFEYGALDSLLTLAKEGGEVGRRAVLCIGEFTNLQELHREIVRKGGVEIFADVIKQGRDSEAMSYAILALCNLAATPDARDRIKDSGAVGFLSSVAHANTYTPEMAAVAQAGLANLQKGEKTMTHVLPAAPSAPL